MSARLEGDVARIWCDASTSQRRDFSNSRGDLKPRSSDRKLQLEPSAMLMQLYKSLEQCFLALPWSQPHGQQPAHTAETKP